MAFFRDSTLKQSIKVGNITLHGDDADDVDGDDDDDDDNNSFYSERR